MVGENGKVYAVDIHELAIESVKLHALKGGTSLYFEGQSPSNSPKGFLPPLGIQRGKAPLSFTKNASAIHPRLKRRGILAFFVKKIEKYNLQNVEPVLVDGYRCDINDRAADAIYALDIFHMIKDPVSFLRELHRTTKSDGFLIIDNGHQSRKETKQKIANSTCWHIVEETKPHLRCTPL